MLLLTAAGAIDRTPALAPRRAFAAASIALFAASVAATVAWSASMAHMSEIPLHGGWSVSSAWIPTCGQSWGGAAASFVGMWAAMMTAMMLPSLAPLLWRHCDAQGARDAAWLGIGYAFVWIVGGIAVFVLGAALVEAALRLPAVARAAFAAQGPILLLAGAFQFTAWKARHLACCRQAPRCERPRPPDAGAAWAQGLRLGMHCSGSCAGLTAVLLVAGVMDLRAMAAVAAAITCERLAPAGVPVAQAIGTLVLGSGLAVIARAAGLA